MQNLSTQHISDIERSSQEPLPDARPAWTKPSMSVAEISGITKSGLINFNVTDLATYAS